MRRPFMKFILGSQAPGARARLLQDRVLSEQERCTSSAGVSVWASCSPDSELESLGAVSLRCQEARVFSWKLVWL